MADQAYTDEDIASMAAPGASGGGLDLATMQGLENTQGYAKAHGVDPFKVVSSAGAVGMNQVTPGTARQYGFDPGRLTDPKYNDEAAQAILADLNKRYNNDAEAAAIAYNAGPGHANAWLKSNRDDSVLPKETQGYVQRLRARTAPVTSAPTQQSSPTDADIATMMQPQQAPGEVSDADVAGMMQAPEAAPVQDDQHPGFVGTLMHGARRGADQLASTFGAVFDPTGEGRAQFQTDNPGALREATPDTFLDQPLDINKDDLSTFAEKGLSQLASGWPTLALAAPTGGGSLLAEMGAFGAGTAAQSYGENVKADPKNALARTALESAASAALAPVMRIPFPGGRLGQFGGQMLAQTGTVAAGDIGVNALMGEPLSTDEIERRLPSYAVGAILPSTFGAVFHAPGGKAVVKGDIPSPQTDAVKAALDAKQQTIEQEVGLRPLPEGATPAPASTTPLPPAGLDAGQQPGADVAAPAPELVTSPENVTRDASPAKPTIVRTVEDLDAATQRIHPENTAAEIGAMRGRYAHIDWRPEGDRYSFDIALENASGGVRRGKTDTGEDYEAKMPVDYGYVKGTKGADGQPIDVFMGPVVDSPEVFIINTKDTENGRFDEHKFMLGFPDEGIAQRTFEASYGDNNGASRIRSITPIDIEQFDGIVKLAQKEPLTKPIEGRKIPNGPPRPIRPMSLLAAVRKAGGLRPDPELTRMHAGDAWGLMYSKGKTIQQMADHLADEGYLKRNDDTTSPEAYGADHDEFLEKLHDELQGVQKHYSVHDSDIMDRWNQWHAQKNLREMRAENERALKQIDLELPQEAPDEVPFAAPKGWDKVEANPKLGDAEKAAIDAEVRKMAPGVDIEHGPGWRGKNGNVAHGYYDAERNRLAYSDRAPDAQGIARHEVMHAVWSLLTDRERNVLLKAAPKWFAEHKIIERYPGLKGDKLAEEAVAERFRAWMADPKRAPVEPHVRTVFQRMKAALMNMVRKIADKVGRTPKPEEIFEAIRRGDVGARPRQPGTGTKFANEITGYQIVDNQTGKPVSNVYKADPTQARRARHRAEKMNLEYGSHRYTARSMWKDNVAGLSGQLAELETKVASPDGADLAQVKDVGDKLMTELGNAPEGAKFAAPLPTGGPRPLSATGLHRVIQYFLGEKAIESISDVGRNMQTMITPMAVRAKLPELHDVVESWRARVKDYMGGMRLIAWDEFQDMERITKQFAKDPAALARMHDALARESEEAQAAKQAGRPHQPPADGLSSLSQVERDVTLDIMRKNEQAWTAAKSSGMVKGDFLPYYAARKFYEMTPEGSKRHSGAGSRGSDLNQMQAPSPRIPSRVHRTEAQSEAAAQAATGKQLQIVRDIRTNIIARAELQRAIAIRQTINGLRELGQRAGQTLISVGKDEFEGGGFTVNHPAFMENYVRTTLDTAGNPTTIWDSKPIFIHKDFEGPLRTMLSQKSSDLEKALMNLKAKTMTVIMWSPIIHNAVVWGKALMSMPGKVLTGIVYREGNRFQRIAPDEVREALFHGLAPVGHSGAIQDINGVLSNRQLDPGRSITAHMLAAIPGYFDKGWGDSVLRGIDRMGDFVHNTLLWDRVRDLQFGLYLNFRDDLIKQGIPRSAAAKYSATFANQFAGSIPMESMSHGARKLANFTLFSRSFTLGNLSVFKTAITGLPRDIQAQLLRDFGAQVHGKLQSKARNKARMVLALDTALFYVGNSLLQSAINTMGVTGTTGALGGAATGAVLGGYLGGPWGGALGAIGGAALGASGTQQWWNGDRTFQQEGQRYVARMNHELQRYTDNPWTLIDPFSGVWSLPSRLSSTMENEPGRQNKIRVGEEADGTAIYVRNPTGKFGEEMVEWPTAPFEMLKKKLSPMLKPFIELFMNSDGFGNSIVDPHPESTADYLGVMGKSLMYVGGAQIPSDNLNALAKITGVSQAANELTGGMMGTNAKPREIDPLKVLGPMVGLTFSKGAPGGPLTGLQFAEKSKQRFQQSQVMPQARDLIRAGQIGQATQILRQARVNPSLITWIIKTTLNPRAYQNPKAMDALRRQIQNDPDAQFQLQQLNP